MTDTFFPLSNLPGTGDKGEASAFPGREKELLEQHAKALQQDLEDQEEAFQRFRAQMIEEIREIETAQRQMDERIKILEVSLGWAWAVTLEPSPGT